jgi:hypothetical protein
LKKENDDEWYNGGNRHLQPDHYKREQNNPGVILYGVRAKKLDNINIVSMLQIRKYSEMKTDEHQKTKDAMLIYIQQHHKRKRNQNP